MEYDEAKHLRDSTKKQLKQAYTAVDNCIQATEQEIKTAAINMQDLLSWRVVLGTSMGTGV